VYPLDTELLFIIAVALFQFPFVTCPPDTFATVSEDGSPSACVVPMFQQIVCADACQLIPHVTADDKAINLIDMAPSRQHQFRQHGTSRQSVIDSAL
jgi:hypothetical protein